MCIISGNMTGKLVNLGQQDGRCEINDIILG